MDNDRISRTVSFIEKIKIKHIVRSISRRLHNKPFQTLVLKPELYWIDLCKVDGSMRINKDIMKSVISDVWSHLLIEQPINEPKILYTTAVDIKEALPKIDPVRYIDEHLYIDVRTWVNDSKEISNISDSQSFLFMLLYKITKIYLQMNGIEIKSEYIIHIAFFYLGFGNYYTFGSPSYFAYNEKKDNIELINYSHCDWSDWNEVRRICHN